MDFEGSLDLLGRHLLTQAIFPIDTDALFLRRLLQEARAVLSVEILPFGAAAHGHLLRNVCVFFHLLLRVPEPLVDLILLQVQLFR